MDCRGFFPESLEPDSDPKKPKRYVIAFIGQCTLWPELCAVSDITAPTVIRTIFDNIVTRFGYLTDSFYKARMLAISQQN
jgi:hypothetical protein